MWFLGFSTSNPRNFWIFGAILIVILILLIFKKLAVHLEPQASLPSEKDIESQPEKDRDVSTTSDKIYTLCCSAGVIRTYALEELKMATKDFKIRIGVGATSFVYLAELGNGIFGAVKRVMEERGGSRKIFLDEISVLLRISHPNLVGLLGFCLDEGEQLLLLEYVPNKSLFDKMHTNYGQSSGILSWSNRLSIAIDVARALDYLHSQADPPIIHRDIKSSNILLIDNNHAKLADFGLCKLGHSDPNGPKASTSIKGSLGYVDTNYLKTGIVSTKSDVYSFGVLLLELITGLKSYQGSVPLAEETEECRRNEDVVVLAQMLDPKLKGDANLEQLRVLVDIANSALLENCEARPKMNTILEKILSCTEPQSQPELPV